VCHSAECHLATNNSTEVHSVVYDSMSVVRPSVTMTSVSLLIIILLSLIQPSASLLSVIKDSVNCHSAVCHSLNAVATCQNDQVIRV